MNRDWWFLSKVLYQAVGCNFAAVDTAGDLDTVGHTPDFDHMAGLGTPCFRIKE